MKQTVPVVFATDKEFAPYCSTSIASLLRTRDLEREYRIYVFYDKLDSEDKCLLESMSQPGASVECVNVSGYIDKKLFYTHGRQSIATYYRFFVGDVFPQYDKILYLDSDIAILKDVGELYDVELGNNLLGGVVIYRGKPEEKRSKEEYLERTMGVTPDKYINAGILVMNLELFRQEKVQEKCISYLETHRQLKWMDQDVLNGVCKGRILFLPEKWNMSQFYYDADYSDGGAMDDVAIVHYLNRQKPWWVSFRRCHLFFYQAASWTPYADSLRCQLLACNNVSSKNPRQEMIKMASRGEVGPRYFWRCVLVWAKGKTKRFIKRFAK